MNDVLTVIPVFNGECFLEDTLQSLARQTRRPNRVIVIDDASTDGTRDLVRSFAELPCALLENDHNLGLFPNLNRALEFAKEAEFFHLLLADDRLRPNFMKTLLASLQGAPVPSFAYCLSDLIDAKGEVRRRAKGNRQTRSIRKKTFLHRQSLLKTIPVGSAIIRSGRMPLPIRFREDMPHLGDCVFFAELASASQKIIEVGEVLCEIRQHEKSETNRNVHNLDAWVTDEFRAMQFIAQMMPDSFWKNRFHSHHQRCLFAARSLVKQQWTREKKPDFANQIHTIVARETSYLHRLIARIIVILRDHLIGPNLPK